MPPRPDASLLAALVERGVLELADLESFAATGRIEEGLLHELRGYLGVSSAASAVFDEDDRYELIRLIGQGGMGDVYLARDRRLGRQVALKLLFGDDDRQVARCLREARAQAMVIHDGVCQVHETGKRQGRAFIAMRFIDGPSLAALDQLTLAQKVQIARDVALALHEAHRQGVIHRDVKPSNVLVEQLPEGGLRPVLTDFGLAHQPGVEATISGNRVLGTPSYMSPEQAAGEVRVLDRRTDVYSLGATLYHLLVGEPPFTGESVIQTIIKVTENEPVPPRRRVRGLPEDLEIIVLKCLMKNPSDRYESALAVAEDLSRHIAGQPILGRRLGLVRRARLLVRRHPRVSLAGAVLGSALLVLVGLTVRSSLEARRQARWAQGQAELGRRLGEEIKEMEWVLRAERMLPLHDTGPAEQRVRARLATMRGLLRGDAGDQPILRALGRGHLALGDLTEARAALEAAAAYGKSGAELHWALGYTLLKQYTLAQLEVHKMGGTSLVAERKAALASEYLVPARSHLEQSRGADLTTAGLLDALLAYQDGRDDALALARATARAHPLVYEAHALAGQILAERALAALLAGSDAESRRLYDEAIAAYEDAARIGRSDAAIYDDLSVVWMRSLGIRPFTPATISARLAPALLAADRVIAVEPASEIGYRRKADLYVTAVSRLGNAAPTALVEAGASLARVALEHDPENYMSAYALANMTIFAGDRVKTLDPTPFYRAAAAIMASAHRRGPGYRTIPNDRGEALLDEADDRLRVGLDPSSLCRQALEAFAAAARIDPKFTAVMSNAIDAHAIVARWLAGRGAWDPRLEDEVARLAAEMKRLSPRRPANPEGRARLLLAHMQYGVASGEDLEALDRELRALLAVVQASSPNEIVFLRIDAEASVLRAEDALGRAAPGDWPAQARRATRRCLDEEPTSLECLLAEVRLDWAAGIAGEAGALDRALVSARRAALLQPRSARSHHALAETHRRLALADARGRGAHIAAGLDASGRSAAIAPDLPDAAATRAGLELLAAEAASEPGARRAAAGRALAAFELAGVLNPRLRSGFGPAQRRAMTLVFRA